MIVKDTICAIATGMGNSGIGIIRVSGDSAIEICDKIFSGKKNIRDMKSYTAAYGYIVDPAGADKNVIDEVVVLVMKAPNTYTTEDTVEIDCHGGVVVIKKILELVIRMGARVAEPGEFTKRAFLGGRIDMTQAEAVMDVIGAKSDMALSASMGQLRGKLSEKIKAMRDKLLYHTAYIESALDDPENYSLDGYSEKLKEDAENIKSEIEKLVKSFDNGRIVKEGIRTAIIGRPNAGKSSVLNMLLGEERAIVTDIEGTTRDTLEETIQLNGIILNLIDTAGIRNTGDVVEKIGVEKAKENISLADLVLYIVDGAADLNENDFEIIKSLSGKKVITLINKNDLETKCDTELLKNELKSVLLKEPVIINISAKEGNGRDELSDIISSMFFAGNISYNDEIYISNARHKEALLDADVSIKNVIRSIDDGMEEDFFTIDLMACYESLGLIIGEALEDDLADKIFREFCMGK